jgi:uncharacterized protein (DUF1684 family)
MRTSSRLLLVIPLLFSDGCEKEIQLAPISPAAHGAEWNDWHTKRAAWLTTPGRPLSYTGLHWIHAGSNTIGGDSANAVVLAGRDVPRVLGILVRDGDKVRLEPARGVRVTVDSAPAVAGRLRTDADSGGASRVEVGTAGFRIIKRLDSLGVRTWDAERPTVRAFAGVTVYPLDERLRLAGRFTPLATPKTVRVMTEAGMFEEEQIVGTVGTTIAGQHYDLTAFVGTRPTDLFFTFTDSTSGDETYGFRFLHAALDTATKAVTLDWNYAYNPDCAFTPYATCPLPPPENRIRAAIRAGERRYGHDDLAAAPSPRRDP